MISSIFVHFNETQRLIMTLQPVIALDIGHSACKIIVQHGEQRDRFLFPSVVSPAVEISDAASAADAARETVEVEGRKWFVGLTAVIQGGAEHESGLSETWTAHHHHQALLMGAVKKVRQLRPDVDLTKAVAVLGLPAAYYAAQKPALVAATQAILPSATVMVLPQPMGPYLALQYDEQGRESDRKVGEQAWACLDIGHWTSDVCLVIGQRYVERAKGSGAGAYKMVEALAGRISQRIGSSVTMLEAQQALVAGHIKVFGKLEPVGADIDAVREAFANDVLEFAAAKIDRDARGLDGVLVAGGAASMVVERIQARWPNAVLSPHGRFDVAEGYARSGMLLARDNLVRSKRQAAVPSEVV